MSDQSLNSFLSSPGFENNLLALLFDRMPMGIAILDTGFNIIRFNPTWADFSNRYAPADTTPLAAGVNYFDHLPGTEPEIMPLFNQVLSGETVRRDDVRMETGGIITYWDIVLSPLVEHKQITGILAVSVDITQRMEAQLNLEHRVNERTAELENRHQIAESLRDIIRMINDNTPLDTFLEKGARLAADRLNAAACVIHQFDIPNALIYNLADFGMGELFTKGNITDLKDLESRGAANYFEATLEKKPTYTNYPPLPDRVDQVKNDPAIPEEIKIFRIKLRQRFASSFSVPLFTSGEVYGGMVFYYEEPQEFTDDQIQLGLTFAEQVGLAIENARLHQQDQARQRELQILLDVAASANSSLNLEHLLSNTLDLIVSLLGASRAGVSLIDASTGYLHPYLLRPERQVDLDDMSRMMAAGQDVVDSGEMMYIDPDTAPDLNEPGALIPIQIREKKLGLIGIIGEIGTRFSSDQLVLFKSIADQLGVAIENARLYQQAEETAVTAERNRLARDLHDAVTQTLFSSSLIADVLPKIWERDPEEGSKRLEELRQLTRGALSEMRTLLFELRPASLADADLGDLIGHLVYAFSARTRLEVDYQQHCLDNPPAEIKEIFYRITQESFNNIAKHAQATRVEIGLECRSGQAHLFIRDNGMGFDSTQPGSEGLGLGIMKERAGIPGAELIIQSQIDQGTEIKLSWQLKEQES